MYGSKFISPGVRFKPGLPHGFCGGDFPGTLASDHPLEIVWQGSRFAAGVFALRLGNRDALSLTLPQSAPLSATNTMILLSITIVFS